nr:rRNA 2'-O-methyltransferase fibrillarin-like [Arachis hypogaea]
MGEERRRRGEEGRVGGMVAGRGRGDGDGSSVVGLGGSGVEGKMGRKRRKREEEEKGGGGFCEGGAVVGCGEVGRGGGGRREEGECRGEGGFWGREMVRVPRRRGLV